MKVQLTYKDGTVRVVERCFGVLRNRRLRRAPARPGHPIQYEEPADPATADCFVAQTSPGSPLIWVKHEELATALYIDVEA